MEKYFSYFSSKTYLVGTQKNHLNEMVKNHLNEMVLLSTQNICLNWMVRNKIQFYTETILLVWSSLLRHSMSTFIQIDA